jgi:ERCC4-type nuclease
MTKGTQDEAAHWVARRKEQEMVESLQQLRRELNPSRVAPKNRSQTTLDEEIHSIKSPEKKGLEHPFEETVPDRPTIIADHRERSGGVLANLHSLGAKIDLQSLDVGDFVLSNRVCVERKRCDDFVHSMMDGRLFGQLTAMQEQYAKPILILEGESLWGHANVRPEAVMGAMGSITVDLGIPILQCRDAEETARLLIAISRREQGLVHGKASIRGAPKSMADDERLRHILAGFPDIDSVRADALLEHFGSLHAIFGSSESELCQVPGIGPATAAYLTRLIQLESLAQTL